MKYKLERQIDYTQQKIDQLDRKIEQLNQKIGHLDGISDDYSGKTSSTAPSPKIFSAGKERNKNTASTFAELIALFSLLIAIVALAIGLLKWHESNKVPILSAHLFPNPKLPSTRYASPTTNPGVISPAKTSSSNNPFVQKTSFRFTDLKRSYWMERDSESFAVCQDGESRYICPRPDSSSDSETATPNSIVTLLCRDGKNVVSCPR